MKKVYLLAVAACTIFAACSKSNKFPSNSSAMSFVNGCGGSSKIDAKVNAGAVQNATGVAFQKASPYLYVASGSNVTITYYLSDGTPLVSGTANLAYGSSYSAFAGGGVGATRPFLLVTQDDLSAPASNSAKIRFVNLSPDSLQFDAAVGTNTVAKDIASGGYSNFTSVVAGSYELKAGDPGNISSVISGGQQTLAAGKIYTIILTGTQSAGSAAANLKLTLLTNK